MADPFFLPGSQYSGETRGTRRNDIHIGVMDEAVRAYATLLGLSLSDDDLAEVVVRLRAVARDLEGLRALDLASIEPVAMFPDDAGD